MPLIRACRVDELDDGETLRLDREPPIAVVCSGADFYAIDDTCSHGQSSLAEGYVEGDVIECAWHMGRFCLKTGAAVSPPATRPVATYPVSVEAGEVFVHVP